MSASMRALSSCHGSRVAYDGEGFGFHCPGCDDCNRKPAPAAAAPPSYPCANGDKCYKGRDAHLPVTPNTLCVHCAESAFHSSH